MPASVGSMPYDSYDLALAKLRPTTPAYSVRYSKSVRTTLSHTQIPTSVFSRLAEPEPRYLPEGWSSYIQPEGQLYFYNKQSRVLTEAYIYSAPTLKRISFWIDVIERLACKQEIKFSENVELFLQLDGSEDGGCSYYLVDHSTQSEFWLQDYSSEELDLPPSLTLSQLRWISSEHYWTHVEYFPSHLGNIRKALALELISILTHARADHLTSSVGTFPYTADQCKDFIDIIRDPVTKSEDALTDTYVICVVARLWAQVARHRFLNFYGEENARLSRDQRMVDDAPRQPAFPLRMISRLFFFDMPRRFNNELGQIWVDNLVYADPWKQFINRANLEWKEAAQGCAVLILLHAIFYAASLGLRPVALASLALSTVGLITGAILSHYHQMPLVFETNDAANFLAQTYYDSCGFAPLSMAYSLPKASLFWSMALIAAQTCIALFVRTNVYVASVFTFVAIAGVVAVVAVLFFASLPDIEFNWFRMPRCLTRFIHRASKNDSDLEKSAVEVKKASGFSP